MKMKSGQVKQRVGWNWMRPEAVTIRPEASIGDAIHRMAAFGIHHLLVTEKKKVVGLLEARDVVAHEDVWAEKDTMKVSQLMRVGVPAIDENTDLKTALEGMLSSGCSALPLSRNGEVCGILTETDLIRLLYSLLSKKSGLGAIVERGEAWLSSFQLQNLFKLLSDAGF